MASEYNLSDEAILKFLDERRAAYEGGHHQALWDAIDWCGWYQAVLPEWAVDAIVVVTNGIRSGHIKDFNEAFAFKRTDGRSRAKVERLRKKMMDVTYAIYHERLSGRGLDEGLLEEVGKRFGLTLRQARDCYTEGLKQFPRENWHKPLPSDITGTANIKITMLRRTGRAILRDS